MLADWVEDFVDVCYKYSKDLGVVEKICSLHAEGKPQREIERVIFNMYPGQDVRSLVASTLYKEGKLSTEGFKTLMEPYKA